MITTLLVLIFSFLSVNILQTKAFKNKTIQTKYLYIQAKNHKSFLKNYIRSLKKENLETINKISFKDKAFDIEAFLEKKDSNIKVEIFIKSKKHDVSLYEGFILK